MIAWLCELPTPVGCWGGNGNLESLKVKTTVARLVSERIYTGKKTTQYSFGDGKQATQEIDERPLEASIEAMPLDPTALGLRHQVKMGAQFKRILARRFPSRFSDITDALQVHYGITGLEPIGSSAKSFLNSYERKGAQRGRNSERHSISSIYPKIRQLSRDRISNNRIDHLVSVLICTTFSLTSG